MFPSTEIRRLMSELPVGGGGLAAPDLPYGSPCIGPLDWREAYTVFLVRHDGSTEVFTSCDAAWARRTDRPAIQSCRGRPEPQQALRPQSGWMSRRVQPASSTTATQFTSAFMPRSASQAS